MLGAPFDGGTSHRPGARFGPQAIRTTDYLPHDGSRPSLALRTDGLRDLRVVDAGDVEMYSGDIEVALPALEAAVERVARAGAIPVILGGDHSIAYPDAKGVANVLGPRPRLDDPLRRSRRHRRHRVRLPVGPRPADAPAHWSPARCAATGSSRSGCAGTGRRPRPSTGWPVEGFRSYEMTEISRRGLDTCLTEASQIATDDCDGVFLSVDIDVCDPGHAPGTGTPEPGGLTARQLLDAVRRLCLELPIVGIDVVEVSPPYDHADITAALANRVVLEALSAIARRRRRRAPAATRTTRTVPSCERLTARGAAVAHTCEKEQRMPAPTQKSLLDTVPKQLLIGGSWRDATGGNTLAVEDPATGRTLTHVADATVADGRAALDAAVAAQGGWAVDGPPRARRDPARRIRADHRAGRRVRPADDPRDGQAAGRVARRGGLRRRVLPVVLRGGRAGPRPVGDLARTARPG